MGYKIPTPGGGDDEVGGGGAVDSVNGQVGVVVLTASDVGALTEAEADAAYTALHLTLNAQVGTSYTPVLGDDGDLVTLSNAGAITVTMPQDSDVAIPVGGQIHFVQLGAGQITFAAGTGATINSTPTAKTRAQYSTVTAIKRAANTWLLVGDLAAT
jgi:hypothetical protein